MALELTKRNSNTMEAGGARPVSMPAATGPLAEWLGFDPFDVVSQLLHEFRAVTAGLAVTQTEQGYFVEVPVAGFAPGQIEVTYRMACCRSRGKPSGARSTGR